VSGVRFTAEQELTFGERALQRIGYSEEEARRRPDLAGG